MGEGALSPEPLDDPLGGIELVGASHPDSLTVFSLVHPKGEAPPAARENLRVRSVLLLVLGAATVGVLHSVLPDHWVPLAVVARTQRWSVGRLARVSFLAAAGHVLTSIVLGGVVALIGLQFQRQIAARQGEIIGGVLVVTGLAFLVWGLTGRGHPHEHGEHQREDDHHHTHEAGEAPDPSGEHAHQHRHGGVTHSHRHHHDEFIRDRAEIITHNSERGTLAGQLAAVAVPFGAAASPDLTFLPFTIAASALGTGPVVAVLGVFSLVTMATFVGLTVVATLIGYEMHGEWLEKNANTITAVVLIVIGILVFAGV